MMKVHLQFHAEPHELLCVLPEWLAGVRVHVVVERFSPTYSLRPSTLDGLCEETELAVVDRVALSLHPISTDARSGQELFERSPTILSVLPGVLTDDGLRETLMSAIDDDPASSVAWRRVRRRALSSMRRGAVVVNPVTGDRAELGSHPFTQGALDLYRRGVPMLALGGWNLYELDDRVSGKDSTGRGR